MGLGKWIYLVKSVLQARRSVLNPRNPHERKPGVHLQNHTLKEENVFAGQPNH